MGGRFRFGMNCGTDTHACRHQADDGLHLHIMKNWRQVARGDDQRHITRIGHSSVKISLNHFGD